MCACVRKSVCVFKQNIILEEVYSDSQMGLKQHWRD